MANVTLQEIEEPINGLPVPERLLLIERVIYALRTSGNRDVCKTPSGMVADTPDGQRELTLAEMINANIPF